MAVVAIMEEVVMMEAMMEAMMEVAGVVETVVAGVATVEEVEAVETLAAEEVAEGVIDPKKKLQTASVFKCHLNE